MTAAHYIGDTVSLAPVPAIVRETAAHGWPHPFTSPELTALAGATALPAVCLSSMMQEVKIPANSGKKSSVCSSDVGAMCSLQGRTVFPLVGSSSSFRGNKVVALVSVVFAAVALGYHLFWRWKYKNS